MFFNASAFNNNNQPLNWNTSNVKYMSSMFKNASAFNQDISNWDTKNVINMDDMFSGALVFNRRISWYTSYFQQKSQENLADILTHMPKNISKTDCILNIIQALSELNILEEVDFSKIVQLGVTHFNISDRDKDGFITFNETTFLGIGIYNDITEAFIKFFTEFIIGKYFADPAATSMPIIILRKALDLMLQDHDRMLNIIESISDDNMITRETYNNMVDENKTNTTIIYYSKIFDYKAKLDNVIMAGEKLGLAKEKAEAAASAVRDITSQLKHATDALKAQQGRPPEEEEDEPASVPPEEEPAAVPPEDESVPPEDEPAAVPPEEDTSVPPEDEPLDF